MAWKIYLNIRLLSVVQIFCINIALVWEGKKARKIKIEIKYIHLSEWDHCKVTKLILDIMFFLKLNKNKNNSSFTKFIILNRW